MGASALSQAMIQEAIEKFLILLYFPLTNPEMLPSILPLIVGLIVVGFYYGRYRYEELGWGAAVSNTLFLTTTGIALIYRLGLGAGDLGYMQEQLWTIVLMAFNGQWSSTADPRFVVAAGIIGFGSFLILLDFYHLWPKGIAFRASSGFTVYTLAYVAIAIVYSEMAMTQTTYIAAGGLIGVFYLFIRMWKRVGKSFRKKDNEKDSS